MNESFFFMLSRNVLLCTLSWNRKRKGQQSFDIVVSGPLCFCNCTVWVWGQNPKMSILIHFLQTLCHNIGIVVICFSKNLTCCVMEIIIFKSEMTIMETFNYFNSPVRWVSWLIFPFAYLKINLISKYSNNVLNYVFQEAESYLLSWLTSVWPWSCDKNIFVMHVV